MTRVAVRLITTVALTLTACNGGIGPGTEPPQTAVASFQANATDIGRNTTVTLTWQVDNPGTATDTAPCSITRHAEHEPAGSPFPVACSGSLTEIPPAPSTATYIRYQLNALQRAGGYLTQIVTIDVADDGDLLWLRQVDGTAEVTVAAVAVDRSGFPVIAGRTLGSLGGTHAGGADAFVRRYAPNGTVEWTRQFGTATSDRAPGITVDTDGDVVLVGNLGNCAFTRKYTATGSETWTRQPCLGDSTPAVATDAANNVIAVVSTYDPDTDEELVQMRSYTPTGNDRGTVNLEIGYEDWVQAIATDPAGNLIVVGTFDYGWGVFVRKFTANGQSLWSDFYDDGGGDSAYARGVAVDRDGNVIVVGGIIVPSDAYDDNVFVRKLSPAGAPIWTRVFGTTSEDCAGGVAVDTAGNVVVVGSTTGTPAQPPMTDRDVFVRKYDAAGEELWTRQFGINASDWARHVAVDTNGAIFVAGDTYGATFNRGFLAKLAK